MAEIKVRNQSHSEFEFSSIEEFVSLIQSGGITAEWEIWHQTAGRWLSVTLHPLFASRMGGPEESPA